MIVGNIGNLSVGFIIVNWFENSLIFIFFFDNEVFFEVCFIVFGVDGLCLDLEFILDVVVIEFFDVDENVIFVFFEDGIVCIEDGVLG